MLQISVQLPNAIFLRTGSAKRAAGRRERITRRIPADHRPENHGKSAGQRASKRVASRRNILLTQSFCQEYKFRASNREESRDTSSDACDTQIGRTMVTEDQIPAQNSDWLAAPPSSGLPPEFRLLCVGPTEPDWIGLTLQLDAVGCNDPKFRWVDTASEAMKLLRNENFDCIVIECWPTNLDDVKWDASDLLHAIRSSGCSDPIVLLTQQPDDGLTVEACRSHCEILVSSALWSSRALVNVIQQSIRLMETTQQNHHHAVANHRRLVRERDEADHLLRQQRDIIRELEAITQVSSEPETDHATDLSAANDEAAQRASRNRALKIPEKIKTYYHELLRTYVIMGSGSLGEEIAQLANVLAEVGLSPRDTLSLHLEQVEHLVSGLGNRSSRHVMSRADLLALELVIHIGECYQQSASEHAASSEADNNA